ncbi:MAG: methyltransferase domain-containing protein [Planctomycetes bacterium]|nr:methyltransferase domain-containing protein [Planctomycetota bacterium]
MTSKKKSVGLDYTDRAVQDEILIRQRRNMWSPEQIGSLSAHFRLAPGMALLDAGCGYGYSLRTFGPRCLPGGRLVGLDREPSLLETAARLAKREGIGSAAEFHAGDIFSLPFDTDTFDAVLMQVVMCHLAEPERALDELIRVAKPGGCIAVFDNAVGGCPWGWDSTDRPTVRQAAARCEHELLSHHGRRKLGRGDWSVGLYLPAWMEQRGLRDVDARVNELVRWIAPPYRSPAQQVTLENTRAQCADDGMDRIDIKHTAEQMRAAGCDERTVRNAMRSRRRRTTRWREAMDDGTAAFTYGGSFWCAWGFKP